MCNRPDFEGMKEDENEALLSLFKIWHGNMMCWLDEKDAQNINWIDEFCSDVRAAIISLQDTPELKELIGQTGQMENDNRV
jgi:hypothetical protein